MLGRLKMSVQEVIDAYKRIMGQVFTNKVDMWSMKPWATTLLSRGFYFESEPLEDAIREVIKQCKEKPEVKLNINPMVPTAKADPTNKDDKKPPEHDCKV